ncbi:MAG: hypothetical protein ACP5FU_06765 [Nitrososphaeria archaeon]
MFLTEKRDKSIKGRMVYNGKPTREWLSREDAASPTVALESIMLTAIVDAKEKRDIMTADVPNAFIQAQMPNLNDANEYVFKKITGVLVDLLVEMAPEVSGSVDFMVFSFSFNIPLSTNLLAKTQCPMIALLNFLNKFP